MKTYGLVPARSGSKGLPDKNVLVVGGHPLLAYAITYGRKLDLDKVIVSTDSSKYADIALRYGAECPYLRGAKASSDAAREEDILEDLQNNLSNHGIEMPDLWVWLKPTNPFRSVQAGNEGIKILRDNAEVDSVRIVSEADMRLQKINRLGYLEPITSDWDRRFSKLPRDAFPKAYQPFNQEIFRHRLWRELGSRFMGDRIHPIVQPRITGLDIDDVDTFEIVKALIEANPRPKVVDRYIHI